MSDVTIRVLIVDDQALVRAGFRMILDAAGRTSRSSARRPTAREAVERSRRLRPTSSLMDVRMPRSTASRRPAGSPARDGRRAS